MQQSKQGYGAYGKKQITQATILEQVHTIKDAKYLH